MRRHRSHDWRLARTYDNKLMRLNYYSVTLILIGHPELFGNAVGRARNFLHFSLTI